MLSSQGHCETARWLPAAVLAQVLFGLGPPMPKMQLQGFQLTSSSYCATSVLTSGTALVVGRIKHCQVAFFGCCCGCLTFNCNLYCNAQ